MSTLTIGMDMDGVLYPYTTQLARWGEHRLGLEPGSLNDEAKEWYFYRDWGWSDDEFLAHHRAGVLAGVLFTEGHPLPGSVSGLRRLYRAGHTIHYVTDRAFPGFPEPEAAEVTWHWLRRSGFPVGRGTLLTVTKDKASVDADVFLDDGPAYIRRIIEAGKRAIVWDAPYNRTLEVPAVRVISWLGFEYEVTALASAPPPAPTTTESVAP